MGKSEEFAMTILYTAIVASFWEERESVSA